MSVMKAKIDYLSRLLHERPAGYLDKVDAGLTEIVAQKSPAEIDDLLSLLNDFGEDEAMFMIVHTIERWEDHAYCMALQTDLERLWKTAPRWTQILHIRVMNSPNASDEYIRLMKQNSISARQVARDIFVSIGKKWPKLVEKVNMFLAKVE